MSNKLNIFTPVLALVIAVGFFAGAGDAFATGNHQSGKCEFSVKKTVSTAKADVGEEFTYAITVKNIGGKDCKNVRIADHLEDYLVYVSETHGSNVTYDYSDGTYYKGKGQGGKHDSHTVRWKINTLQPGKSEVVSIKVKVTDIGEKCEVSIPNYAKVTSDEYGNSDWESSDKVYVKIVRDCTPGECKLVISKSSDKSEVAAGEVFEYTITFKNVGDANCTGSGVKIVDELDTRLIYVSESHSSNVVGGYENDPPYKVADHTLRWNADTLSPNEDGWVKVKVKAKTPDACTETIPNKAKITAKELNNMKTWVESNVVSVKVKKDCDVKKPVCDITANLSSITHGDSVTLTWSTENATSFTIAPAIGSVTPVSGGSVTVTPSTTTTYVGTAVGPHGSVECNTKITVIIPGPACTLSVSRDSINSGESVIVSWISANVTAGFISPLIGTTTPVSSGSMEVYPSSDTTFTGTYTGVYGQVQCQVKVKVTTPGCVTNCGGGFNPPNVVLYKKATDQPLVASVFLSQIPYTGFEAGPALTILFWFAVALFAAVIAYFFAGDRSFRFVSRYIASFAGITGVGRREEEQDVYESSIQEVPQKTEPYARSTAATQPLPTVAHVPQPAIRTEPAQVGIPALADVIESRAHAAGVLMSPESVDLAINLSPDRSESLRIFGDILNEAVRTIPREDGWIMLTSDRLSALSEKKAVLTTHAGPVVAQPAPVAKEPEVVSVESAQNTVGARVDEASATAFVGAVLSGDRDIAFGIVRSMEHANVNPSTLMTSAATVLDRLYRVRQGGKNGVDSSLVENAANVNDGALHALVEVFTHSLDTVYSNPFTGIKLALAQAFDVIG